MAYTSRNLKFTGGTTQTVTNWNVNGQSGALMTVQSLTGGSAANISIPKPQESPYVQIQDIDASNHSLFIGHNSTLLTNTTNVIQGDIFTKSLSDSTSLVENFLFACAKKLSGSVSLVESFLFACAKKLTASVSLGESFARYTRKAYSLSVSLVESFKRATSKSFSSSVALVEKLVKTTSRKLTGSISLIERFSRGFAKVLFDVKYLTFNLLLETGGHILQENGGYIMLEIGNNSTIFFKESFVKLRGKNFLDSIALIEKFNRGYFRIFTEIVTITDSIFKLIGINTLDEVSLSENFSWHAVFGRIVMDTVILTDVVIRSLTRCLSDVISVGENIINQLKKSKLFTRLSQLYVDGE